MSFILVININLGPISPFSQCYRRTDDTSSHRRPTAFSLKLGYALCRQVYQLSFHRPGTICRMTRLSRTVIHLPSAIQNSLTSFFLLPELHSS